MLCKIKLNRFFEYLGIDLTIVFVSISKVWSSISGIIVLLFISRYLDIVEQGLYYSFLAVAASQVFFEMGLGTILLNRASHVKRCEQYSSSGFNLELLSIVRFAYIWYSIVATLAFICLLTFGIFFFEDVDVDWFYPWVFLCTVTAANLLFSPIAFILEGIGKVKQIAKMRLLQGVSVSAVTCLSLFYGLGLYTIPLFQFVSLLILVCYCKLNFSWILTHRFIFYKDTQRVFDWKNDVLPLLWKTAVAWVCGYLSSQALIPIVFKFSDPKTAGQLGMTMQVMTMLTMLSYSWVSTKLPSMGAKVSNGLGSEALSDFKQHNFASIRIFLILVLGLLFSLFLLDYFEFNLASRFLGLTEVVLLSIVAFFNLLAFNQAGFVRCHRLEKHMIQSCLNAIFLLLPAYYILSSYSFEFFVIYQVICSLLFTFAVSTLIYRSFVKHRYA